MGTGPAGKRDPRELVDIQRSLPPVIKVNKDHFLQAQEPCIQMSKKSEKVGKRPVCMDKGGVLVDNKLSMCHVQVCPCGQEGQWNPRMQ